MTETDQERSYKASDIKVRVAASLRDDLEAAAKAHRINLSEEIRWRLESPLQTDDETLRVLRAIASVAMQAGEEIPGGEEMELSSGEKIKVPPTVAAWHELPKPRALFRAAVDIVLDEMVRPRPAKLDPATERRAAFIAGRAIGKVEEGER